MTELLFHLTPLTPLHIGSGETLEPFEYVISGERMYRFSLEHFMLALDQAEQAAFVERVGQSVPAIRSFVIEHADTARKVARWQAAVSGAASELYQGRLSSGVGHPEVLACLRTGDRLYLPGSSLKGAIRTALLYQTMEKPHAGRDARYLEQTAFRFRSVQEDPFRAFKLADGPPLAGAGQVRAVRVHTRRHGHWEEDVPLLVETIPGSLSDGVEEISVHQVIFDKQFNKLHPQAFALGPAQILTACRNFYGHHLQIEQEFTAGSAAAAAYRALSTHAAAMPAHACLVRLGWGSGHEATTVSYGLAEAKRATSRRLSDDGFPLGWAELSLTDLSGQPLASEETFKALRETSKVSPAQPVTAATDRPRSIDDLEIGQMLSGRVVNIVPFGAFVDLGVGQDGLIHISQLARGRVERVEDVVKKGDRVKVEVIRLEPEKRRIALKLLEVEQR